SDAPVHLLSSLSYSSHTPPTPLLFFFNDTALTQIYTLSLHDALPIWSAPSMRGRWSSSIPAGSPRSHCASFRRSGRRVSIIRRRSEEHTSELQSLRHLVCRLLLEKKKKPTS